MDKREKLAEYAHNAWAGWMKYLFEKCKDISLEGIEGKTKTVIIPEWAVLRWKRQMMCPYSDLPEEEKASDREEADRMLKIIKMSPPKEKGE